MAFLCRLHLLLFIMAKYQQVKPEPQLQVFYAMLERAMRNELRMGVASIKLLSSGAVHIAMPGDLLFSGINGLRFHGLKGFPDQSKFTTRLYSNVSNACLDHLRNRFLMGWGGESN